MNLIIIIIVLLVILIIITNIFTHKITKLNQNNKFYSSYITYMKKIEENRNNVMNGTSDMKYYVNFSFHYKLFNLFELLVKKLDENNIKYFLIGGGLIGYYRHNQSFIPWDDDIDIGIFEEDRDKFHDIIRNLIKEDSNITLDIQDIDKVLYGKKDMNPVQIDIFYYKFYPEENIYSFYMDELRKMWPREKISKEELFPLQEIEFKLYLPDGNLLKEIKIKTVNKSKLYLDRAYPNWIKNIKFDIPHVQYYNDLFI